IESQRGQSEAARAFLEQVLAFAPSPEVTRTAQVKLAALGSPVRATLEAYFRDDAEELRLLRLATALDKAPRDVYVHYLLGRRLLQVGAPIAALVHLSASLEGTGPDAAPAAIRREARRLQLQAAYLAGDCGAVRHTAGTLPDEGPAMRALAAEWVERCDFEDRHYGGPLV
ncbi:hypothetical protein ACEV7J_24495, partial [Vibrio parahaemolyticus]